MSPHLGHMGLGVAPRCPCLFFLLLTSSCIGSSFILLNKRQSAIWVILFPDSSDSFFELSGTNVPNFFISRAFLIRIGSSIVVKLIFVSPSSLIRSATDHTIGKRKD